MHQRLPHARLPVPAGMVLLALAMALFAVLAADLMHIGPITLADGPVSDWFHAHMRPGFTTLLLGITHWHSTLGICLMALAAALVLGWLGERWWLAALALGVPGGLVLNALVKHVFQRARPTYDHPLLTLQSYSFPSGHTAGATVWWGFALMMCLACRPRLGWRIAAGVFTVLMIALTAISRLYLGVHFLSDVLAAAAEGTAWLLLVFMALGALPRIERPAASQPTP